MIVVGSPALRRLSSLKLRGSVRKQLRRLRTPKGLLLTILGLTLMALWVGSVVVSTFMGTREGGDPEGLAAKVRFGGLLLTLLSVSAAFSHRGLYLPREEIERLLAAPVRRSDLVRYRLLASSARSLLGGLVLGLIAMTRMPSPILAFLGILVALQTLPVVNQLLAILLGGLERRAARRLGSLSGVLRVFGLVVAVLLLLAFTSDLAIDELPLVGPIYESLREAARGDPFQHPTLVAVTAPFAPWASMVTAGSLAEFLPWFGLCVGIWFVLFELTARLPIDFRELSLETSASVAARLRRIRRGGGAAAGGVSRRTVGWRIPWLFGHGAAGAVAWRKTGAIVRKAKGTLWVSALVLFFVTVLSTAFAGGSRDSVWFAPVMIAVLGTFYLCAGLRFDFRDELDRMEVIKAWPVPPGRLFTAMLLPEVCLVSVLLCCAVLLRAALGGGFHPAILVVVSVLPLLVLAWVALDNAVFLFSPVRFVPGQEGALQNAGRSVVMMLLRMLLLLVIAACGGGAAALANLVAGGLFGLEEEAAKGASFVTLWLTILVLDVALLWVGGRLFHRFDVARDRG